MICGDFKDLTRRTAFDKILQNKAFNVAKNPKIQMLKIQNTMDINADLFKWFINYFIKKTSGGSATLANKSGIKMKLFQKKN